MNILFEYIKYLVNAKGRHGTHSPFVYTFVDECITIPIPQSYYNNIKQIEKFIYKNNHLIEIEDFGAGSKKLKNKRELISIYKNNTSKGKFAELLFLLNSFYKPNQILELGTSIGIGTYSLSLGNSESFIYTVEGDKSIHQFASKIFNEFGVNNVLSVNQKFDEFISKYNGKPFDLIYIDGHHDGDALLKYLNQLKPISHNDTIFLLDDIRWSDAMFNAWKKIIQDETYHLTMDLFRMGLIIPRHQQEKEHFTIRY